MLTLEDWKKAKKVLDEADVVTKDEPRQLILPGLDYVFTLSDPPRKLEED